MPRVMIMSSDHEPLTILSIRPSEWNRIEEDGHCEWNFLVPESFAQWVALEDETGKILDQVKPYHMKRVRIKFHSVHRSIQPRPDPWELQSEVLFWYGIPDDEELALLLRAAFLPGQVTEFQRQRALAFVQGILAGRG